jgi:hypothetical protein
MIEEEGLREGPLTALLHDCLEAMGEQFAYAEVWTRERISSRRRGVGGVAFRRGKDHEKTQSERDQVRRLLSGALCLQFACAGGLLVARGIWVHRMFLIVSKGSKIKRNYPQSLAREAIKGTSTHTTTQAVAQNVRGHHNADIQA